MSPTALFNLSSVLPAADGVADAHSEILDQPGDHVSAVERLLSAVEVHVAAEAATLPQYEQVARASQDPVVELVMRLVLEDEVHHHELLRRIGATVRDALQWSHSPEALPPAYQPRAHATPDDIARVRALVAEELEGARHLRRIAHEQKGPSGGLVALLLEAMAHDSEKHAKLLTFVQRRLEAHAR